MHTKKHNRICALLLAAVMVLMLFAGCAESETPAATTTVITVGPTGITVSNTTAAKVPTTAETPTEVPTAAPTVPATVTAAAGQTTAPTVPVTVKPTTAPTVPATAKPTTKPTTAPTTAKPTTKPTTAPTTAKPTTKPTTAPTVAPPTTVPPTTQPKPLRLSIMVARDAGYIDFSDRGSYNIWRDFVKLCEEKNLTIDFILCRDSSYSSSLSGVFQDFKGNMPDAVWLGGEYQFSTSQRRQAIIDGDLMALEDILPYSDGTAREWFAEHPAYQAYAAYGGKTWWIGEYQTVTYKGEEVALGHGAAKGVNIRLDWYNKLVAEGKWNAQAGYPDTFDELTAFLKACQDNDVNLNGERDEIYLNYLADLPGCGLGNLFGVPRQHFAVNMQTGKVDVAWESENAQALIRGLKSWVDQGLVPEDMVGGSSGSTKYRIENKVAVYNTYFCNNWGFGKTTVPDGAADPIVIGVLPDKTAHPDAYIAFDSAPTYDNRSFAFTSNLNDPAAAAVLLDILTSDEWKTCKEQSTESYDGIPVANELFGYGVFPEMDREYDILLDEECCDIDTSGTMGKIFREAMNEWQTVYPDQTVPYYAIPTATEAQIIEDYEADFIEVSKTIFYDLITGARSVDDWDSVISELNAAGMQDLKDVYQARATRFFAAYNS